MTPFGERLLNGSRFLFWSLVPCLLAGAAVVTFPVDYDDGFQLAAVLACDVVALLLVLSLWPYQRIAGVRRLLMGSVAVLYTYYLATAWLPGWVPDKGEPSSRWLATAGFFVIGWPTWVYAFLGRFRLVPEPLLIDENEPLLLAAYEDARTALPRLREAFATCPETTLVRFPFRTDADTLEHLWGELLELRAAELRVRVATQPIEHEAELTEHTFPLSDLEDWEVEFPDGTLEGGWTTRAMVALAERESLPVPREIERRLLRYRRSA